MTVETSVELDNDMAAAEPMADWRATLDPVLGDFVQQKGWRSVNDALNSYRHLERMVGGDKLSLPAADAGPEAWGPVWDRLGRPREAAAYALKAPDNAPYDAVTADWFRETAHRIGLTAGQAQALHDGFLTRLQAPPAASPESGLAETGLAESSAPDPAESLREIWGRKYDANMVSARRAFAAFIGDEAPFHDIADALGETALMEMLAKIGRVIGEDSITSRADGGGGPRNPVEALAEIAKLQRAAQADSGHPYVSKTHPEHQALVKRMEGLYTLAYGG